jgi:hypothetical protein
LFSNHIRAIDKEYVTSLTLWKGCENVINCGHCQYCEWFYLMTFSQPFHSVNGHLIKGSSSYIRLKISTKGGFIRRSSKNGQVRVITSAIADPH